MTTNMFFVRPLEAKAMSKTEPAESSSRSVAMSGRREIGLSTLKKAFQATYMSQMGLEAYLMARKLLRGRGEFIFVSAMPKSGSTFLARSLCEITGFEHTRLTYKFERNEQELYLPKLVDNYSRSIVTQQHTRATLPNLQLFRRFEIRPVILLRNIFDVVPSIRDYLLKEGVEGFPSIYATEHFRTLSDTEQYDFLITFAMPWYFDFYASWFDAARDGNIDTLWLTYEELVKDWAAGIRSVLDFYRQEHSEAEVQSALETMKQRRQQTRMNKGVVGRGQALTQAQKDRIIGMTRFYPWVDFSPVGL